MDAIITNLRQASDTIESYLMERRPLNLEEMRNLGLVLDTVRNSATMFVSSLPLNAGNTAARVQLTRAMYGAGSGAFPIGQGRRI